MAPHALIVDDDANNLEVLEQLLAVEGISSTMLKDPTQVLSALPGLPPIDAVLCDLEMPRIDGYTLLSSLRKVLDKNIPIICVSVHLAELDRAYQLGFDGFLGKPLDGERFPLQIARILEGQPVWDLP